MSFRNGSVLSLSLAGILSVLSLRAASTNAIDKTDVEHALRILGLEFSAKEIESALPGLREQLARFERLRTVQMPNSVPPVLVFNPIPLGVRFDTPARPPKWSSAGKVKLPVNKDDLAFYSVAQMAALLKTRLITSEELTRFHLDRLKRYGPKLECVVSLTEELALEQARRADQEIASGKYRGPLHGIPYGAKDLLATKGIRTTWGSAAFKDQVLEYNATVVQKLEEAGAVLVAKLTTGELAWDDIWFGGQTRNPWNLKQGSSGSSAGSASATAAGLVPFAIGSETWGSIVSPATRCGVTGLRPTFGRVSRTGAMTLSWSMDKIGPLCRTVEDCALVLEAIRGPDGSDPTVVDAAFNYDPRMDLKQLRIGYLKKDFDSAKQTQANNEATLAKLRALGFELMPVELPNLPVGALSDILLVEGAAAFDDLTRSGRDDLLIRPAQANWFRRVRLIPAVEYLQANRVRYLLVQDMARLMSQVDVILAPPREGDSGLVTNLTGHPCVVVPNGFNGDGTPTSITFIGHLFGEARLLALAKRYQDATDFHKKHPPLPE